MHMCYRGNLLREKGDAEAAVSSYKNAIMYRPSLAGKLFFVDIILFSSHII